MLGSSTLDADMQTSRICSAECGRAFAERGAEIHSRLIEARQFKRNSALSPGVGVTARVCDVGRG